MHHRGRREIQWSVSQRLCARAAHVDRAAVRAYDAGPEHRHRVPPRRISQMRYGPPMKAVIAPAGTSAGASRTRPSASHDASRTPPSRNAHGISTRSSAPSRARKQVRHDQADEADRPGQRDRGGRQHRARDVALEERSLTCAPRVAAQASPTASRFHWRPCRMTIRPVTEDDTACRRAASGVRSRRGCRSASGRSRTTGTCRSGHGPAGSAPSTRCWWRCPASSRLNDES